MAGPLDGFRVIELGSTVSGPIAGMVLGDQGAEIIKIEPPMIGDLARFMGDRRNGMSAMFATLNRNKRSLVLDLKEEDDKSIFLQLVESADVLIENYRPGVVQKLGIDYDTLSAINPGLVYASITGYGQSGPYQHRRVYDPLIQATAGAAFEQGRSRPANMKMGAHSDVARMNWPVTPLLTVLVSSARTAHWHTAADRFPPSVQANPAFNDSGDRPEALPITPLEPGIQLPVPDGSRTQLSCRSPATADPRRLCHAEDRRGRVLLAGGRAISVR